MTSKDKALIIWRLKDNSIPNPKCLVNPLSLAPADSLYTLSMAIVNNQNTKGAGAAASSPETDSSTDVNQAHPNDQTSPALDQGTQAESASVLFLDIVGFTRLPVNQQRAALKQLLQAVRSTEEYQRASAAGNLLRLPTGDGMALVFLNTTPVEPAACAKHICASLKAEGQSFGVRMGIHSGPVYRDQDIDDKPNVTGDGINLAQRVMSCGDEGHILLSSSVSEFLRAFDDWTPQIKDLGEVKVRHDRRVHIFNLYGQRFGNASAPNIVRAQRRRRYLMLAGAAALVATLSLALFLATRTGLSDGHQKIDKIAIFPFAVVDNTNDERLQDEAEDIARNLRNDLSDVGKLTVKPATESLSGYRGKPIDVIAEGRSLEVQAVMSGQIIKQADATFIEISLTNIQTNSHIWSNRYPYRPNQTKQISEDIIPRLIQKDLSAEEHAKLDKNHTNNVAASNFYDDGRRYFIQRELDKSIESFRKAIEQDGAFAPAHAGLANALSLSPGYDLMKPEDAYPQARAEVELALAHDNTSVEAYYTLGYIQANYDWDWQGASRSFQRALELSRNSDANALYYYAFNYLIPMKRMDEAISAMQTALSLDKNSPIINTNLGWTYYYAGREREAFDQYQKTADKYPEFGRIHRRLQEYYEKNNNYEAALAEYKKNNPESAAALEEGWRKQGKKGYWGQRLKLLEAKAGSGKYVPQYDKALVNAFLGNTDEALAQLESAVKERSEGLIKLGVNPAFKNLRSHPRFIKILQSINLPAS